MDSLEELIGLLEEQSSEDRGALARDVSERTKHLAWTPSPGPQTEAYYCKADVLLYGGEPGGGKAVCLYSSVATPCGWNTIGEIQVGEQVFDEQGRPCTVVAKSEVLYEDTYRITFSDGEQIVAGARHQWVTSTRAERMRRLKSTEQWRANRRASRPSRVSGNKSVAFTEALSARNSAKAAGRNLPQQGVRTTREILDSLRAEGGRANHAVACCAPLALPEADLLIDPYVLGAWLGDGSSTEGVITKPDEELFQSIANHYTVTRHANPKTRGVLGLRTHLGQLGLLGNKHIPPAYLRASFDQRLALLQGLMDTDGHANDRGQCEFNQVRKHLAEQSLELIRSLGIKATMRERVAKLNGRAVGPRYDIKFITDLPVFRLPRKLIGQKRANFRGTHDVRYIEAVEPVERVPLQCIQVDSPNRMYLCGRGMIPTHNSHLLIGLAFNQHKRSLIMRRQYTDLSRIIEDLKIVNGGDKGYAGAPHPKLTRKNSVIDLRAAARVGDEQHLMGDRHDFIGLDEATQFAYGQVRFLLGWLGSIDPRQRTRMVLATNPPLTAEGLWVIKMFAPWLDDRHPKPAKPGELRWFVTDSDGEDREVDGPAQVMVGGKMVKPLSRTFIPSSVQDNPYLARTDYGAKLDALTEPYRSVLLGHFKTVLRDQVAQVIPTAWVRAAQERWKKGKPDHVPMCAIAADCSGGGEDPLVIAMRYDGWYDTLVEIKGRDIPIERIGAFSAGELLSRRRDGAPAIVDLGGGYGGSMYEHLKQNEVETKGFKGAEHTERRSRDKTTKFFNTRSAAYWLFREALDPGQPGGSPIGLPDDPELVADLTAPTFEVTLNGIKLEPKDVLVSRLGRSTDRGDAVVMAWWHGPRAATSALEWAERKVHRQHGRVRVQVSPATRRMQQRALGAR